MVKTKYGFVEGVPSDREDVTVFKGIPIGATTEGAGRFCAPKEPAAWDGVRLCDKWPDRFLQDITSKVPGTFWGDEFYYDDDYEPGNSENGLAVNVFAPKNAVNENGLPVLCWIHGGGFTSGYASEIEFNASNLAAKGIIVVLIQYRLSALGWLVSSELNKENGGRSGNYAVLDMVHGLKWINENIKEFGGDPKKVTIAGQSAGAFSVTMLLRTPLAKGLFRNAIVQSGFNGFLNGADFGARFSTLKDAAEAGDKAIKTVFGENASIEDVRKFSTSDLLLPREGAGAGFGGAPMTRLAELTFLTGNATIDNYVFTEESVDLTRPGALDGINIIIGGTSDEYTTLTGDFIDKMGITKDTAAGILEKQYGKGCAKLYDISDDKKAQAAHMRAGSDASFQKYLLSAGATENNKDHKTFAYFFTQVPSGRNSEFRGAYHSSDLWYMFDSIREGAAHRNWTKEDRETAKIMSTYWANFVKTGDPNGEGLTNWEECTKESGYRFLQIGNGKSEMKDHTDFPERDAFFRSLYQK